MTLSGLAALELCSRIAAVGVIINALEGVVTLRDYDRGAVFDARVVGVARPGPGASPLSSVVGDRSTMAVAMYLRLAGGILLAAAPTFKLTLVVGWLLVAATGLFVRWRRVFGDDGSDQMMLIVSVAFSITLLVSPTEEHYAIGLYFVGAQAILAYVTAGIAKLISHEWRTGSAIQGIFSTRTYSARSVARVVHYQLLAVTVAWVTICFESAFISAALLPFPALIALLSVAAAFHIGSAVVMGLNGFVWAFICTYPAIIYLNQDVRALLFGILQS